jgi:hypothetical protein
VCSAGVCYLCYDIVSISRQIISPFLVRQILFSRSICIRLLLQRFLESQMWVRCDMLRAKSWTQMKRRKQLLGLKIAQIGAHRALATDGRHVEMCWM